MTHSGEMLSGAPHCTEGVYTRVSAQHVFFSVALYLLWCQFLASLLGITFQLYADNLKCVSTRTDALLLAA